MSNCRTAPTSTTSSSSNSSSPTDRAVGPEGRQAGTAPEGRQAGTAPEGRQAGTAAEGRQASTAAIIACGALGAHIREIVGRRGWDAQIHCLPSIWHNSPRLIAPAAERLAADLRRAGLRVVLAYADCGTYGALDKVCERLGIGRLAGLHCYDVFAGPDRVRAALEAEPGTYLLTDFLVRGFRRSVLVPLGLDRHPELWADYFGHYRRLVWFTQSAEPGLAAQAEEVAAMFGLPLTVIDVGTSGLERELEALLAPAAICAKDLGVIHPLILQDLLPAPWAESHSASVATSATGVKP